MIENRSFQRRLALVREELLSISRDYGYSQFLLHNPNRNINVEALRAEIRCIDLSETEENELLKQVAEDQMNSSDVHLHLINQAIANINMVEVLLEHETR